MSLQKSSGEILNQLLRLLEAMDGNQYHSPVDSLSQNSIGGHVRHIIEFYSGLLAGYKTGLIDYDSRERNYKLESDLHLATETLQQINDQVNHIVEDKCLKVSMDLSDSDEIISMETSFYRELAYNIEHAIHHMAIIKIGIHSAYPTLSVNSDFGLAYSTKKYLKKECVQ